MHLIVIGCEYVGKTTFADDLMEWRAPRGFDFHLVDHFTISDSSLSKGDRDVMLGLSPEFKERFQRFQAIYHVRLFSLYRDMLELGFYSEDSVYGPSTTATSRASWLHPRVGPWRRSCRRTRSSSTSRPARMR